MNSKTVYVVGRDHSVEGMFRERHWDVLAGNLPNSQFDLVCFTGGSDWGPHLYGEENIASYCNEARDTFEWEIYHTDIVKDAPKVGICRGGQLFTFTNGGKLIQDIRGHGSRDHAILDIGPEYGGVDLPVPKTVLSCHHQAMVPDEERVSDGRARIIAQAPDGINEVIWFPERRELAFQSHPEWGHEPTTDYFFNLMAEFGIDKAA